MSGELGGEIVARTRLVLDDELLAEVLREILADQSRADVRRSTRRIANEPPDAVVGIVISARRAGAGNDGADEGDGEPLPNSTRHFFLPSRLSMAAMRVPANLRGIGNGTQEHATLSLVPVSLAGASAAR